MTGLGNRKVEVVTPKHGRPYAVVEVPSSSNPNKVYRVDLVNVRCSCPAWIFSRGERKLCKHLRGVGFTDLVKAESSKSEADYAHEL